MYIDNPREVQRCLQYQAALGRTLAALPAGIPAMPATTRALEQFSGVLESQYTRQEDALVAHLTAVRGFIDKVVQIDAGVWE